MSVVQQVVGITRRGESHYFTLNVATEPNENLQSFPEVSKK